MKNIIQFWIIIEIAVYFATIICISIILGMSSCCKLRILKPLNNNFQAEDLQEEKNQMTGPLEKNVEELLLPKEGYPDDIDEYEEVAE